MRRHHLTHGATVIGPPLWDTSGEANSPREVEYTVVGGATKAIDHVVVDRDGVPYSLTLAHLRSNRFRVKIV